MSEPVDRILFTRAEAAKLCGLCEKTLANHTYPKGALVAVRIGRTVRYAPSDIDRWIKAIRDGRIATRGGVK